MHKLIALTVTGVLFAFLTGFTPAVAGAADGKEVFESLHCHYCHKPDQKSSGAMLQDIAKTYPDAAALVKFFSGEADPLIKTEKPGMMRGQMPRLQALSDEEKKALADYIMGFK